MEDGEGVVAGEIDPESEKRESVGKGGLVCATDESEGIRRKRRGRGFSYFEGDGRRVAEKETFKQLEGKWKKSG